MGRYYATAMPDDWLGIYHALRATPHYEVRDHQQDGKIMHLTWTLAEAEVIAEAMNDGSWFVEKIPEADGNG